MINLPSDARVARPISASATAVAEDTHRHDIDGMRGLAVFAIILFHIDASWLPGGFVGVDVFFVVSGWLITQNLYRALEAQPRGIDLRAFYVGRIKRIAPAALACIALTIVAALLFFRAADARLACHGALAAALSATNVFQTYFADHGYFAPSSQSNPFLHLWSLAVEEQFYLLWPALLSVLCRRFRGHALLWVVGAIAGVSFACAQLSAPSSFAYYMLVTRAWELLLGAGLVLWTLVDGVRLSRGVAEVMGLAGLVLVGTSLAWLSEGTPSFPGFMALPSCAGAGLLLLSGASAHRTWTSAALAWTPLAHLGVVSYSAYLYHWPVLAFMRYFGVALDGAQRWVAVSHFVSLTLASFYLVENRYRRVDWSALRAVLTLYVAPTLLIICVALVASQQAGATSQPGTRVIGMPHTAGEALNVFKTDGSCRLPYMRDAAIPGLQWDAVRHYGLDRWAKCDSLTPSLCFIDDNSDDAHGCVKAAMSNCYAGDLRSPCDRNAIGVFGDSFAAQHVGMLEEFGKAAHFSFFNFCVGLCPFFYWPEMSESASRDRPICFGRNRVAGEHLRRFAGRTVVWGGFWRLFIERNSWERFELYFTKTLEYMLSLRIRIIFLGVAPAFGTFPNPCPALQPPDSDGWAWCATYRYTLKCVRHRNMHGRVQELLRPHAASVTSWDWSDFGCPRGVCSPYMDGVKIMVDVDHISYPASRAIGRRIVDTAGVPLVFVEARDRECKPKDGTVRGRPQLINIDGAFVMTD